MPGPRSSWDESLLLEDVSGWHRLEEMGLDAAIGWMVPLGALGRRPVDDPGRMVHVTEERDDGDREYTRPFTAEDRAIVEDSINAYLEDAGIPPQPPDFDWFIRGPLRPRYTELQVQLEDAVITRGGSDPSRIVADLTAVIPDHYPAGWTP